MKPTLRQKFGLARQQAKYDSGAAGISVVQAMQAEMGAGDLGALAVEQLAELVAGVADDDLIAEIVGRTGLAPTGRVNREDDSD